jgi:hypothetical protein
MKDASDFCEKGLGIFLIGGGVWFLLSNPNDGIKVVLAALAMCAGLQMCF